MLRWLSYYYLNIVREGVVNLLYCEYLALLFWRWAVSLQRTWWVILVSSLNGILFLVLQIAVLVLYRKRYSFIFKLQWESRNYIQFIVDPFFEKMSSYYQFDMSRGYSRFFSFLFNMGIKSLIKIWAVRSLLEILLYLLSKNEATILFEKGILKAWPSWFRDHLLQKSFSRYQNINQAHELPKITWKQFLPL